jgi:predicted DCC family thiol-disulfide oxidoreductase YuxK
MCDRFVAFVIPRDRNGQFRFAPQQGAWARQLLAARGLGDLAASTVLVSTGDGQLLQRSAAVFHVLARLSWPWRALAWLRVVPRPLADAVYDQIARRRLRLFGRLSTCRLPTPAERSRFMLEDDQ